MARAHTAGQPIDQHHLPVKKLNHQNVDVTQTGFESPGLNFSEVGEFLWESHFHLMKANSFRKPPSLWSLERWNRGRTTMLQPVELWLRPELWITGTTWGMTKPIPSEEFYPNRLRNYKIFITFNLCMQLPDNGVFFSWISRLEFTQPCTSHNVQSPLSTKRHSRTQRGAVAHHVVELWMIPSLSGRQPQQPQQVQVQTSPCMGRSRGVE